MKFFTKNELIGVLVILAFITIASLFNFRVAIRRARDTQRREDLGTIYNALNKYHRDFGFFPLASVDGRMKACKPGNYDEKVAEFSTDAEFDLGGYLDFLLPCGWGKDSLGDLSDDSYPAYLTTIPGDPKQDKGISYHYLSNGKRYQIYAYLEGEETEVGYSGGVRDRQLSCGVEVCNFGRAFGETPLEKDIEEYENELLQKIQNSK